MKSRYLRVYTWVVVRKNRFWADISDMLENQLFDSVFEGISKWNRFKSQIRAITKFSCRVIPCGYTSHYRNVAGGFSGVHWLAKLAHWFNSRIGAALEDQLVCIVDLITVRPLEEQVERKVFVRKIVEKPPVWTGSPRPITVWSAPLMIALSLFRSLYLA